MKADARNVRRRHLYQLRNARPLSEADLDNIRDLLRQPGDQFHWSWVARLVATIDRDRRPSGGGESVDADRDARFVAAYLNLRKVHETCATDGTTDCAFADDLHEEYELIYGRPCKPERCGAWIADAGGALTPAECPNPRPCSDHPCEPEPGPKTAEEAK